jgi:hypothetical protein
MAFDGIPRHQQPTIPTGEINSNDFKSYAAQHTQVIIVLNSKIHRWNYSAIGQPNDIFSHQIKLQGQPKPGWKTFAKHHQIL